MASTGQGSSGSRQRPGAKRPAGQELDRNGPQQPGGYSYDEVPATPVPLKYVVAEAVKRWFDDALQEAQRGDVKQQALVGQMFAEGYGTPKDLKAAKEWSDRATSRGYRMQGVYCEL